MLPESPPPGLEAVRESLEVEGDSAGESGEDDDDHDRGSDQDERRRCEFDGSQRLCFGECLHKSSVGVGVGPDYWGFPPTNPETPKPCQGWPPPAEVPWLGCNFGAVRRILTLLVVLGLAGSACSSSMSLAEYAGEVERLVVTMNQRIDNGEAEVAADPTLERAQSYATDRLDTRHDFIQTVRFKEELAGEPSRFPALRRAGEGTGGALTISALTSIAGFTVLGMAPMPIFAVYGVLTAVMIALAVLVTLLVLPSLLLFVTPSLKGEERERLEWERTRGEWVYEPHKRGTATQER